MEDAATQDINQVWKRFETILDVANGLINYAPVFRDYYYEALDSFRRDNVQYIEVRVLLPPVSDIEPCANLEGGQGSGPPPPPLPLKNHKNIGVLRNTGLDSLNNHKATKPAFNVGPSSAC